MIKVHTGSVFGLGVVIIACGALGAVAACDSSSGGSTGTAGGTASSSSSSSSGTTTGNPTTSSSSSSSSGASTSGANCGTGASYLSSSGYLTVGASPNVWQGYAFTAVDTDVTTTTVTCTGGASTVSPVCTSAACTPALNGSFSGTLSACSDYATFAMFGWNLNQPMATSGAAPPGAAWPVPATGGVTITFSNTDPSNTVRLQVQDNSGTAAGRWCTTLTSGVEVPWTSLVTNCWTGGTPQTPLAAGTGIYQAAVEVVGTNSATTPYNICVSNITLN